MNGATANGTNGKGRTNGEQVGEVVDGSGAIQFGPAQTNTKVACMHCRDHKLKCDKLLPSCTRCSSKGIPCVYVSHKKTGPKPYKRRRTESGKAGRAAAAAATLMPLGLGGFMAGMQMGVRTGSQSSQSTEDNRSLEERLGLADLGLNMDDVEVLHNFFWGPLRDPFMMSEPRYMHYFREDPMQKLYLSYFVWNNAAYHLPQYARLAEPLFERACALLTDYFNQYQHSSQLDTMSILSALAMKSYYEFLAGKEMSSALTIGTMVRLGQVLGYDRLDVPADTLAKPMLVLLMDSKDPNVNNRIENLGDEDDGFDPEMPLKEERRITFWRLYLIDKFYSLLTGFDSALPQCAPNRKTLFTKLPSPMTFLTLEGETVLENVDSGEKSCFLHDAVKKLENDEFIIDVNRPSSSVIALCLGENALEWCRQFYISADFKTVATEAGVQEVRHTMYRLLHNFSHLQENLVCDDSTGFSFGQSIAFNVSITFYQTVLLKVTGLLEACLKVDSDGSTIPDCARLLFTDLYKMTCDLTNQMIQATLREPDLEMTLTKPPIFITAINMLRSLLQCLAYYQCFTDVLHFNPDDQLRLEDNTQKLRYTLDALNPKLQAVQKLKQILTNGQHILQRNPQDLSFLDVFITEEGTA